MAISHAGHNHPATPAGRRACRAGQELTLPADTGVNAVYNDFVRKSSGRRSSGRRMMSEWMTRGQAEKTPKKPVEPARIQPRRSGARVSATGSTCVQAALHVDAHGGRCACGWVARKIA